MLLLLGLVLLAVALLVALVAAVLQGALLVAGVCLLLLIPVGAVITLRGLGRELVDSFGFRRAIRQLQDGKPLEDWRRRV